MSPVKPPGIGDIRERKRAGKYINHINTLQLTEFSMKNLRINRKSPKSSTYKVIYSMTHSRKTTIDCTGITASTSLYSSALGYTFHPINICLSHSDYYKKLFFSHRHLIRQKKMSNKLYISLLVNTFSDKHCRCNKTCFPVYVKFDIYPISGERVLWRVSTAAEEIRQNAAHNARALQLWGM